LPPFDLVIQMQAGVQEDERTIDIKALSSKGQQLLYKIDHIDT
jgi:hypothetical protein